MKKKFLAIVLVLAAAYAYAQGAFQAGPSVFFNVDGVHPISASFHRIVSNINGKVLSTTSATAQVFYTAQIASGTGSGGTVFYCLTANQSAQEGETCQGFSFAAQNTAGTITCAVGATLGLATITSTGTLTDTPTCTGGSNGVYTLSTTPTWTTLVPTSVTINATIENNSQQLQQPN